jgi:Radical SAM superfamily
MGIVGVMILVHPPVAKPCEPPAGIARLAGALKRHEVPCRAVDANLEAILNLLEKPTTRSDTWTSRAGRHVHSHVEALRTPEGYENPDRYRRAVSDINRILGQSVASRSIRLSLANYSDAALSPLRSEDLLVAAEDPEGNPLCAYFRERIEELLNEEDPKAIGISLNYLSQALCAFSMIGLVKKEHPRLRVMLGGGLVTSWMRRPGWHSPFAGLVDDTVAGPGEGALLSFFGKDNDGLCSPDYHPFLGYGYFAPGLILPYSASTGCYWHRCSFCPERAEGNAYRPVPPDQALKEVKEMAQRLKPVLVHFLDNAMSPALLENIAREGLDTPWYGFARFTHHLADPDFCAALKRSGCIMLKLGMESGDQQVLDCLRKGIRLETVSQALRCLKKEGIGTYVYLLFGTPPETPEGARRTFDFTVRHGEFITFLNVAIFNMPVYGADAERYDIRPFYEGDLSLYTDFVHPSGWNRSHVRKFLDREFKRHPVIAPILRRDPPIFTSNHAAFFLRTRH